MEVFHDKFCPDYRRLLATGTLRSRREKRPPRKDMLLVFSIRHSHSDSLHLQGVLFSKEIKVRFVVQYSPVGTLTHDILMHFHDKVHLICFGKRV